MAKRNEIEKKLKNVLSELFDLREIEKKMEMERIESKLESLEDEIRKRKANKEVIVESRLKQLTGQNRIYEW